MNFTKQINAISIPLLLSILLFQNTITAQGLKTDSVFWDNGNVSLLSQLGSVWIIVKQGSDKKEVRIAEVKKQKGVLVYEKEKCLHDIAIHNIERIQPGKHPLSYMNFYSDNTPYIKRETFYQDPAISYSDFKSLKITVRVPPKSEVPKVKVIAIVPHDDYVEVECDTIIDAAGIITLAKIIEIDSRLISFKKITNPNGPIYIKASNNATITKHKNCTCIHLK